MDQRLSTTEGATPVEDDGFVTVGMGTILAGADTAIAAAARPEEGQGDLPAPLSRSERFLASMKAEKDEAEASLLGIEAEIISVQECAEAAERQAQAEYSHALASAKVKLQRTLDRLGDDREEALAELEASKADILGIVAMLSGGIEAASQCGGGK